MYIIYSKPNCQQCTQAKMLLEMKGLAYEYLTLGADYELEDVLSTANTTVKAFPIVFKDGTFIGGYPELRGLLTK